MPEHRSFLVLDAEDSSSRLDPRLMTLRAELYRVVVRSLRRTGIADRSVTSYDRGDGVLLVLAGSVRKSDLAGPFLEHLQDALAAVNRTTELEDWLRLRLALGYGEIERDAHGWAGEALTVTFRLANSDVVKGTLRAAGRAQCVVVCSDEFYRGVVRHDRDRSRPESYRMTQMPVRGSAVPAWVRVLGYTTPPLPTDLPEPVLPPQPTGFSTIFNGSVEVGRDFRIGPDGGC